MAGQSVRMGTATAITATTLLAIDKNELLGMLRTQDKLSDCFDKFILSHKNRVEEALIDQEAARASATRARPLWKSAAPAGRRTANCFPRDFAGNSRYYALSREYLHEQI